MKVIIDERYSLEPPFTIIRYNVKEEEFFNLSDEDSNFELFDGELIMRSPASYPHEDLFGFLYFLLRGFAERKQLGRVLGSRFPIHLAQCRIFEPDIMFISRRSLHQIREKQVEAPVELVVEILSETTRRDDLGFKRLAYQEAKIPEIWVIDPDGREVIADNLKGQGYVEERLSKGTMKSGVLEGFWVDLDWLWQRPQPDALECLLKIL